jgi:hypothetical protein
VFRPNDVELTGRVPANARPDSHVACEWRLRNSGSAEVVASFYLRASRVAVVALSCTGGPVRFGRFYGSARILIPAGASAVVSGLLGPCAPGGHAVRTVVVTQLGTIDRTVLLNVTRRRS